MPQWLILDPLMAKEKKNYTEIFAGVIIDTEVHKEQVSGVVELLFV